MPTELASRPKSGGDEATVAALRAGEERAFVALFERHYPAMKHIARGYVDSDAVAEEVVQETWLAVVVGIDRFQGRSSLSTWIYSILINQAKTHSSRERRTLPFSAAMGGEDDERGVDPDRFQSDDDVWPGHWATPPRPWNKPDRRALSLEAREHIKQALQKLPDRQRLIVCLRDVEGLESAEVRERLDLSEENQRVLLHRGRSRLRAELEQYMAETSA